MAKSTLRSRKRTMQNFITRFMGCNASILGTVSMREFKTAVLFESAHADKLAHVRGMADKFPGVVATIQTRADRLEVQF